MRYLLIGFALSLLGSLWIASREIALLAVGVESLLSGLILYRSEGLELWSVKLQACDLILVRGLIVPIFLIKGVKHFKLPSEFETVPANLVIWIFATVLFILSFWFGQALFPSDFQKAGYFGTAISGVLTGLFILSNQNSTIGQMIGLLTLEASIALTEIVSHRREAWEIQLGLSIVFIWMIVLFLNFLKHFSTLESKPSSDLSKALSSSEEGEVL